MPYHGEFTVMRLAFTLVAFLGAISPVLAIQAPMKPMGSLADRKKGLDSLKPIVLESQKNEYRITEKTEVLLDGRSCKFKDVPADAVIVRMETVSTTNWEVLKVQFRSATRSMSVKPRRPSTKK